MTFNPQQPINLVTNFPPHCKGCPKQGGCPWKYESTQCLARLGVLRIERDRT